MLCQYDVQGNVQNYKYVEGDDRKCKDEDRVEREWLVGGDSNQMWRDSRNVESEDDDGDVRRGEKKESWHNHSRALGNKLHYS